MSSNSIVDDLRAHFISNDGSFRLPGNTGRSRTIADVCQSAFFDPAPTVYDLLSEWDSSVYQDKRGNEIRGVLGLSHHLVSIGQLEGAWAFAQLHYDQLVKKEAAVDTRLHKGHPACGLAILGRSLGSSALCRHYALLSSLGDIAQEDIDAELIHGGYARTMLEQFYSSEEHEQWKSKARGLMNAFNKKGSPIYLEAFLAAGWFGDSYAKPIISLAQVTDHGGKPFVDVLLDAAGDNSYGSTKRGVFFEAAAGLLISSTPGFEVRSARKTSDEQIDIVVRYERDPLSRLMLPDGPGLVECKSSPNPVSVSELRDFAGKCQFHRVGFGILITRANISGSQSTAISKAQAGELVRRRLLVDGLTVLVLDIDDLRGKARELRSLSVALTRDHEELVYGPIADSFQQE